MRKLDYTTSWRASNLFFPYASEVEVMGAFRLYFVKVRVSPRPLLRSSLWSQPFIVKRSGRRQVRADEASTACYQHFHVSSDLKDLARPEPVKDPSHEGQRNPGRMTLKTRVLYLSLFTRSTTSLFSRPKCVSRVLPNPVRVPPSF
jgi:hypothetical protein